MTRCHDTLNDIHDSYIQLHTISSNLVPRSLVGEAEGEDLAFGFAHKRTGKEIRIPLFFGQWFKVMSPASHAKQLIFDYTNMFEKASLHDFVPPDCNITLFSINYVNCKAAEGFQVFQCLPVVVNRNSFYRCWESLAICS